MKEGQRKVALAIAVGLLALLVLVAGITYPRPRDDEVVALGYTNFTGLEVAAPTTYATGTPAVVFDSAGLGTILEVRDAGTPVWYVSDGGAVYAGGGDWDLNGNKLDLDVDADTSLTADTDDQIDVEIGGADVFALKDWGASSITTDTTKYLFEVLDTTNVMTGGTNSLAAINIDLGIGNSTGGTNNVYGILIDEIVHDAQNTETAIDIAGTGWVVGIGLGGNVFDLDADDDTSITADTDDQIDYELSGSDEYQMTTAKFDLLTNFLEADISSEHIMFPTVASQAFTYTASAGGTVVLFTIGDGEIWIVHDVFVNVGTNFDCTGDDCTVHVGDGGDEDGLCDLDDGELQTTDVEVTGGAAGWQCFGSADTIGAYIASGRAHIYAPSGAAETIDAVLAAAGDDFSAGAATAYVVYTRIQ